MLGIANHKTPVNRSRAGSALISSLILMTLIATIGAALVQVQAAVARRQLASSEIKRALYIAEAGIAEAFGAIAVGKSGNIGTPEIPAAFGGGVYWVEASDLGEERVVVSSTGLCGSGRFALDAVVQKDLNPLGRQGIHGDQAVTIQTGAVVDGFNSAAGDFDSQLSEQTSVTSTGNGAKITSNGDIRVEGDPFIAGTDTWIFGDLRPGVRGTATLDPDVLLAGSSLPLEEPINMPVVKLPDLGTIMGPLSIRSGRPYTISGDSARNSLQVNEGSLTIKGPARLRLGSLRVLGRSDVLIDTSFGNVIIYIDEELTIAPESAVHFAGRAAESFAIYLGADGQPRTPRLDLPAGGLFQGVLYAPRIDIVIPERFRFFGSLAGRSVELREGAHISYDVALASRPGLGLHSIPILLAWTITELPDEPLVKLASDPILYLASIGSAPVSPLDAHKEQFAKILTSDGSRISTRTGDVDSFALQSTDETLSVQWLDPDTQEYFPTPGVDLTTTNPDQGGQF